MAKLHEVLSDFSSRMGKGTLPKSIQDLFYDSTTEKDFYKIFKAAMALQGNNRRLGTAVEKTFREMTCPEKTGYVYRTDEIPKEFGAYLIGTFNDGSLNQAQELVEGNPSPVYNKLVLIVKAHGVPANCTAEDFFPEIWLPPDNDYQKQYPDIPSDTPGRVILTPADVLNPQTPYSKDVYGGVLAAMFINRVNAKLKKK